MKLFMALLLKDLRLEVRTKETLSAVFGLALLIALILGFSLPQGTNPEGEGGLLWVAILFPAVLIQGRTWASEADRGTLEGLLASPVPPTLLWFAKFIFALILTASLVVILVPAFMALLGAGLKGPVWVFVVALILGVVGISAVGTSMSALTARAKFREILLPILLIPLLVPLILGDLVLTGSAFSGVPHQTGLWILLMAVFDVVYLAVPLLLADLLLEV